MDKGEEADPGYSIFDAFLYGIEYSFSNIRILANIRIIIYVLEFDYLFKYSNTNCQI